MLTLTLQTHINFRLHGTVCDVYQNLACILLLPILDIIGNGKPFTAKAVVWLNGPFLSSPQSLFQSESRCKIFVMVIISNFNMNEN